MKPETILILQDHKHGSLFDTLYQQGITTKLTSSIQDVMEKIHHANFSAVILDCEQTNVDILEAILNVRDIKESIPIVLVVDKSTDENCYETYFSINEIYLVNKEKGNDWLAQQLKKILNQGTLTGDQLS